MRPVIADFRCSRKISEWRTHTLRTKGEFAAQAQTTALGASRLQKKVTDGAEKTFAPVQLPTAMDVKQFTLE